LLQAIIYLFAIEVVPKIRCIGCPHPIGIFHGDMTIYIENSNFARMNRYRGLIQDWVAYSYGTTFPPQFCDIELPFRMSDYPDTLIILIKTAIAIGDI